LSRKAFKLPLRMALLAAAYLVAGKMALLLAIPPGFATAVWPSAGIALAACLAWGNRVWPGIFLGSLLVNLGTGYNPASTSALLHSLTIPTIIAAGASLQALCGALLVRRFVGFPLSLNRLPRISLLLLIGGPGSCLIGATIGVSVLQLAGRIGEGLLLTNWSTWWLGDSLGVMVFLPLAAAWGMELQQAHLRTRLSVMLPLLLAMMLTVGLFLHVRRAEWQNRQLVFSGHAQNLAQAIITNVDVYRDVLFSIDGLFQSSERVDRDEFHRFVAYSFSRHQGIQALEWVPLVGSAERSGYESSARVDGYPDFGFSERDQQGRQIPASERPEYAPVYYLEPYAGNEAVLGFDLASSPARFEALQRARATGQPVATPRVKLIQDPGTHYGILLLVPIYTTRPAPTTESERQAQFQGVVAGVFRIDELVEAAIRPLKHDGFAIEIYDLTAPVNEQFLYSNQPETTSLPMKIVSSESTALSYQRFFEVGSRRWQLRFSPTANYLADQQLWGAWAVLTGGLIFSSLLGSFLLLVVGRKEMTERVVELRTGELQESNLLLKQEIAERQRAEANLQLAQAELENRVEIRTAELGQSNRQLQQETLEHRQSQELLHTSETRFRRLVQAAPDGIVIMDAEHRIVSINDQAERLFGYKSDELHGELHRRLLPERFLQRHDQHQEHFLENPSTRPMGSNLELYGLRKDGSEFPLEISLSPLPTPEGLQVICIVRDITERKHTEQELAGHRTRLEELVGERTRELEEKSEALEKATRLKSEFLANMSHELRTPMNSIIGFTERVILKSGETLPQRQLTNLHTVKRNAHQLLALINSLLDISKIEAGRMEVLPEEFDLQTLLQEVVELTETLVADKGLSMQLHGPDQSVTLVTDRAKLRQILVNLVGNGVKFTEQGGITLRVLPAPAESAAQTQEKSIVIQVSDTGVGISPENQQKIFEAFVQGDGSDARRSGGTGLGLAIVKSFVAMLQGNISLDSVQGQGTTLTLTLPQVWEELRAPSAKEPAESTDSNAGPLILCIDDDAEVLHLLAEHLSDQGYNVLTANSGTEALQLAEKRQPRVITLDIHMPQHNGWEVLQELKNNQSTRDIPVLILTIDDDGARGLQLGATDYLRKPLDPKPLLRKIEAALRASPRVNR